MLNRILLSSDSGKRLWPLSNDARSKQFLKIFKKADGTYESMLLRMRRMIYEVFPNIIVTIAISQKQLALIKEQFGNNVNISIEPERRDTFPASDNPLLSGFFYPPFYVALLTATLYYPDTIFSFSCYNLLKFFVCKLNNH